MKLFLNIIKTPIIVFITAVSNYEKRQKRHQNCSLTYWKSIKTKVKNPLLYIDCLQYKTKTT